MARRYNAAQAHTRALLIPFEGRMIRLARAKLENLETSFKDSAAASMKTGAMTTASHSAQPRLIEIMRAGRHTDANGVVVEFTQADLQSIADAYDPQLAPAPVVVGHPKMDDPAYGWVKRLVADGDSLFAEEEDVEPQFAEMRQSKRFRNRSASFYTANSPSNPKPGALYLKHVGWLGAAAPAVKGLKQVSFAEDQGGTIEFALNDRRWVFRVISDALRRFRDRLIDTDGQDTADKVLPDYLISSISDAAQPDADLDLTPAFAEPFIEESSMTQNTDLATRERQLKEREDRVAAQERDHAAAAAKARRADAVAFAESLIQDGRLLPAQKDSVVELQLALPTNAPLAFGEGDGRVEKPAVELFRELLGASNPQIDFTEKSERKVASETVDFASPAGTTVDAAGLALHSKAIAYQAQHPGVPYLAAVKAVGG